MSGMACHGATRNPLSSSYFRKSVSLQGPATSNAAGAGSVEVGLAGRGWYQGQGTGNVRTGAALYVINNSVLEEIGLIIKHHRGSSYGWERVAWRICTSRRDCLYNDGLMYPYGEEESGWSICVTV